jgi:hypothetical protein
MLRYCSLLPLSPLTCTLCHHCLPRTPPSLIQLLLRAQRLQGQLVPAGRRKWRFARAEQHDLRYPEAGSAGRRR